MGVDGCKPFLDEAERKANEANVSQRCHFEFGYIVTTAVDVGGSIGYKRIESVVQTIVDRAPSGSSWFCTKGVPRGL